MIISKYKEISFSDKDIVNTSDFIPQGEFNPHSVKAYLIHEHGYTLGVAFADCLSDCLDILADKGKLDSFAVSEKDFLEMEQSGKAEQVSFLGNNGAPFDIESIECLELPVPRFSFCSLFNAHLETLKESTKKPVSLSGQGSTVKTAVTGMPGTGNKHVITDCQGRISQVFREKPESTLETDQGAQKTPVTFDWSETGVWSNQEKKDFAVFSEYYEQEKFLGVFTLTKRQCSLLAQFGFSCHLSEKPNGILASVTPENGTIEREIFTGEMQGALTNTFLGVFTLSLRQIKMFSEHGFSLRELHVTGRQNKLDLTK